MIKDGFYENAIFRFIVSFPETFPNNIPEITFQCPIFHPMISENGRLDLTMLFPEWNFNNGNQLINLLTKIRMIFSEKVYFEEKSSFNPYAAEVFTKNPNEFTEMTLECANKAREGFYSLPEDCPYRFDKLMKIPDNVKEVLDNSSVR